MDKHNKLKLNYKRFAISVSISMSEDPNSRDSARNTSNVNISVSVTTSGSSYNNSGSAYFKGTVTCNGQTLNIAKTNFNISKTTTKTVYSASWEVTHNEDGSCGDANASIYVYLTSSTDKSATASCPMSTIPRYTSITRFNVNKRDETSVAFDWWASDVCDYAWYSKDNGASWIPLPSNNVVGGLSQGAGYNFKLRVRRKDSQLVTESGTVWQQTYYYPHVQADLANFTIGIGPSINLYNPLGRHVKLSIINRNNGRELGAYDGSGYQGIVSGEFNTASAINAQYNSIPNAQSGVYFARCYCYDTNTTYDRGDATYFVNVSNCTPIFTNFDYEDVNEDTIALTGNNKTLIKGYSRVAAIIDTANKANGRNYSTMKTYRFTNGSVSVDASYSDSQTVTTNSLLATTKDVIVSAIDSRGLSTSVTKSSTFIDYFKPSIKYVGAERSDGGIGEQLTLSVEGIWWENNFGDKDNELKDVKYYYKKTNEDEYHEGQTPLVYVSSEGTFRINLEILGDGWDASSSYNLKIIATDLLGTSDDYITTISSGTPGISIYKNCVAIGAKYDERIGGVFQVNGQVGAYYPVGSVILTSVSANPNDYLSGNWVKHGNIRPQGADISMSIWQRE